MQTVKFTPRELAIRWGVPAEKIRRLCRRGELPAVNLADSEGTRPKYAIDISDVEAFEQRRAVKVGA